MLQKSSTSQMMLHHSINGTHLVHTEQTHTQLKHNTQQVLIIRNKALFFETDVWLDITNGTKESNPSFLPSKQIECIWEAQTKNINGVNNSTKPFNNEGDLSKAQEMDAYKKRPIIVLSHTKLPPYEGNQWVVERVKKTYNNTLWSWLRQKSISEWCWLVRLWELAVWWRWSAWGTSCTDSQICKPSLRPFKWIGTDPYTLRLVQLCTA